jgi:hypothetical protein
MCWTSLILKLLTNHLMISLNNAVFNSVESKMMQVVDHLAITSLAFILNESHHPSVFPN